MKCSKCGAQLDEAVLYCPVCGQEIRWVPDYTTMETLMHQHEKKKKIQELPQEVEPIAVKKRKPLFVTGVVLVSCILALMLVVFLVNRRNYHSLDYQLAQAESYYSNKDYEKTLAYVDRALSIEPANTEANLLMAQVYTEKGETGIALPILQAAIKNEPANLDAYGQLIRLYESLDQPNQIKTLLDDCEETTVLEKFADYICEPPTIVPEAGTYKKKQDVQMVGKKESDLLYYTLDGTPPTKESMLYESAFSLKEGVNTIRVVAINEKGISSNIVEERYTLLLTGPEIPVVSPSSGAFEEATKIKVTVPDGCTAYYTFDGTPTIADKKYVKPITMPQGEHIFSVILIDENGKSSNVASETYVLY